MSAGAILTLGLGTFGSVNSLPTLGYLPAQWILVSPMFATPGRVYRHKDERRQPVERIEADDIEVVAIAQEVAQLQARVSEERRRLAAIERQMADTSVADAVLELAAKRAALAQIESQRRQLDEEASVIEIACVTLMAQRLAEEEDEVPGIALAAHVALQTRH